MTRWDTEWSVLDVDRSAQIPHPADDIDRPTAADDGPLYEPTRPHNCAAWEYACRPECGVAA